MIVVSFGTIDGVYDKYLKRLMDSCEAHGLAHDMEFTSPSPRMSAVLDKPSFIRRMLHKHNDTILWLDADAIVTNSFQLPRTGWDIGLTKNTIWRERKKNPTSAFAISVSPTERADQFLETWDYLCARAELCRYGDHKRLTWAREMRAGEYRELRLEEEIPKCIVRDFGRPKQAFLR